MILLLVGKYLECDSGLPRRYVGVTSSKRKINSYVEKKEVI